MCCLMNSGKGTCYTTLKTSLDNQASYPNTSAKVCDSVSQLTPLKRLFQGGKARTVSWQLTSEPPLQGSWGWDIDNPMRAENSKVSYFWMFTSCEIWVNCHLLQEAASLTEAEWIINPRWQLYADAATIITLALVGGSQWHHSFAKLPGKNHLFVLSSVPYLLWIVVYLHVFRESHMSYFLSMHGYVYQQLRLVAIKLSGFMLWKWKCNFVFHVIFFRLSNSGWMCILLSFLF